jgi:hypothetical protein
MAWVELDSAVTSPAQTDLVFGPITTPATLQGRVLTQLDNLSTQSPYYARVPDWVNQAKDEILMLGLALGKQVLDQVPRLQHWRWYDITVDAQNYLPLPERMLWLDDISITRSTVTPNLSSVHQTYPVSPWRGNDADWGTLSRTATGYPQLYKRAGGRVELWPTPDASPTNYLTYVIAHGTRMDKDLSTNGDVLLMSPRMQLLCVDLAVVIGMENMNWEEAPDKRAQLESRLARLIGLKQKEQNMRTGNTRVSGMGGR